MTVPLIAYDPLTEEEAESWLRSISWEELVQYVVKWDFIEHSEPEFSLIEYSAIVMKDGSVIVTPVYPEGVDAWYLMVGDPVVGFLHYRFQPHPMIFEDLVPEEKRNWIVPLSIGVVGGGILGCLITIGVISLAR